VVNSTTPQNVAHLTANSIKAANPQASISLGSYGSVSLSTLLSSPFRTFLSGPEMVEAHYRSPIGSDPSLVGWFHVRYHKGGRIWIRAIVENGYLDIATTPKTYAPTVTVGGVVVYGGTGSELTHYAHTRWAVDNWIGGDPQVSPKHDTAYLKSTRLVPNYMDKGPSTSVLDGLYQNYTPNQNGNWTASMGAGGYQDQIGLLPRWDALYVTSAADIRAYRSVLANAKALNSYGIVWNDSLTKLPLKPSTRSNWSTEGAGGGGATQYGSGPLIWEVAHHGSGGYLAYLLTGDYYYLETMQNQSALVFLVAGSVNWATNPPSSNNGTSRYLNGQTRGYAWGLRTLSQYVGIAPEVDPLLGDYQTLLANNIARLKAVKETVAPAGIGYLYEYNDSLYGTGLVAPWQQHYFIQSIGMGAALEPLPEMSAYLEVRNYLYRGAVGILGDSSGYCFWAASAYNIKSSNGLGGGNPNLWYKNWSDVYRNTFPTASVCGNTLLGDSGGHPTTAPTGYWGNLLPAIAYAVDDNAPGAAAAWERLSGASNWQVILDSGFDTTPNWGIVPRTTLISGSVAGECGSANGALLTSPPSIINLCSRGTPSAVSGAGPWFWTCQGSNGGQTASCMANLSSVQDTVPPSSPAGLAATATSSSQIQLNWITSTDNIGVSTYQVFRNGSSIALVTAPTTSFLDSGLSAVTTYTYSVIARDAAGNSSAQSASTSVRTLAANSGVPAPILNLQPGQWLELPNTKIRSVLPDPLPRGYPPYLVEAWNGGTVDSKRSRLLVWGGGHADYWGNEMYALDLPTMSIQRIVDPSPLTSEANCTPSLPDGTPTSRHTYGGLTYAAHIDSMFAISGSLSPCGFFGSDAWKYDFTEKQWRLLTSSSPVKDPGVMAVYDQVSKLVYIKDQTKFYSYSFDSNQFDQINASTSVDYHLSAALDSKRRKFVMLGDGVQILDLATGALSTMQTTNAPTLISSKQSPGIAYDPIADRIVAWHGGSNVYALNMDTGVWDQVARNQGPTVNAPVQGTFGRFGYIPQYGVFALINNIDQNAWIFRLSNGPTTRKKLPLTPATLMLLLGIDPP